MSLMPLPAPHRTPRPRPRVPLALAAALCVVVASLGGLGACSDAPQQSTTDRADSDDASDASDASDARDASDDASDGDDAPDLGGPDPCDPEPAEFGAACETDDDCRSGVCVADEGGAFCTQQCSDTCPTLCDGRRTRCLGTPVDAGIAFVCLPQVDDLCRACVADNQCSRGRCLRFADGTSACGTGCASDRDCPSGFVCGGEVDGAEGQCVPASATCSCTPDNDGLERPCARSNAFGRCGGTEVCDAATGWSECSADEPAEEVCNGEDDNCDGLVDNGAEVGGECAVTNELGSCEGVRICQGEAGYACFGDAPTEEVCDGFDNDCDGVVDQGFVDERGRYVGFSNCGTCGNDCTGRFPNATEIACDLEREIPACVVVACADGFQQVGDRACAPIRSNLCQPCLSDADCSAGSPGARCVDLGEAGGTGTTARVCGRDCSVAGVFGSECPDGYVCDTTDGLDQCVPAGRSCTCLDAPPGFSVACSETVFGELSPNGEAGNVSCNGARFCSGAEFGACQLATEVCDGTDNDCSGLIDDAFRDGAGLYSGDAHCGRCNNDCRSRFDETADHALGVCDASSGSPRCEMRCLDGWVDLRNGTDDGCECRIVPGDDLPDRNPAACEGSCDTNCDGIDGDASRALFVSKTGVDAADAGTRARPLASIGAAVARAWDCGRGAAGAAYCPPGGSDQVYVTTGVYSENIVLRPGVSLYGGFALDFARRDPEATPTTVFGTTPGAGQVGTITAELITRPTVVSGFRIYGVSATDSGASTYALHVANSTADLRFEYNAFFAGNGAAGRSGTRGASGASGADGGGGRLAVSAGTRNCSGTTVPGGDAGASTCGSVGGTGGTTVCPRARTNSGSECSPSAPNACLNTCGAGATCTPLPPAQGLGSAGANNAGCSGTECGAGGAAAYDYWTDSGVCYLCGNQVGLRHIGGDGAGGRLGRAGSGGAGCTSIDGTVGAGGLWTGGAGSGGGDDALDGGGGGGGSAGAGFDVVAGASTGTCVDNLGGSGGGGGGGGCRGRPGTAGSGGGSSFAVFLHFSPGYTGGSAPVFVGNTLAPGRGGDGGAGGAGGAGGLGGFGGAGGFAYPNQAFCTSPGGNGGNGGQGGAGAGGGGGCGGSAFAAYLDADSFGFAAAAAASIAADNTVLGSGGGGRGGRGGAALSAGSTGGDGDPGGVFGVVVR